MSGILRVGDNLIDLSSAKVMAIINVTPDSFFSSSRVHSAEMILKKAAASIEDGAAILDIGGCSTRPGSKHVDEVEEYERVKLAIQTIRNSFLDFPLSIDTYRASVVRKIAEDFGPVLVNDISGGIDKGMFSVVSQYKLPYVLCHLKGTPETMHVSASYSCIIDEMLHYFALKIGELKDCGIYDIIVDPNFGFAKDVNHNMEVVKSFARFSAFGYPLLAGVSRKSFICKTALCDTDGALSATSAMHMALLERGARLLRVHDTNEAMQVIRLYHSFC